MRRAYDALGIQCPTTGTAGPTPAGLIPNSQPRPGLRLPPGNPTMPNLTANMGGVRVLAPPQGQAAPNVSLPLGSDPSSTSTPSSAAQVAANIQQSVSNVQQLFGVGAGDSQGPQSVVCVFYYFLAIIKNKFLVYTKKILIIFITKSF